MTCCRRCWSTTDDAHNAAGDARFLQDAMDTDAARALRALNAPDLQLVSLVVFEGYTLAAAAAVLNLTPGAAKTRMHPARQRMKATITGTIKPAPAPALEGERP